MHTVEKKEKDLNPIQFICRCHAVDIRGLLLQPPTDQLCLQRQEAGEVISKLTPTPFEQMQSLESLRCP